MALPSQSDRSQTSARAFMQNRKKSPMKLAVAAGALVLVAGGILAVYAIKGGFSNSPASASAGVASSDAKSTPSNGGKAPVIREPQTSAATNTAKTPAPSPASSPATPPVAPAPLVLSQSKNQPLNGQMQPAAAGPGSTSDADRGPLSRTLDATSKSDLGSSGQPVPKPETSKPQPVDVTKSGAPEVKPTITEPPVLKPPQPTETLAASGSTDDVRQLIAQGDSRLAAGDMLQARVFFSRAVQSPKTARTDQEALRAKLTKINEDLLFSKKVTAGDPLCESYTIQSGDRIVTVAKKRDLAVDWRLIQRINGFTDADLGRLKIGQKIKLVRGPFQAVVNKADYRLDLFAGSPDEPENWIYIRSFKVGLGTDNGTPVGTFVIKNKQSNPPWTNPKTGERFGADDPKNPIGEFWLGFKGVGPAAVYEGFGLHGTIEPESIGQQRSMGCVRMAAEDIALVYEMLTEQISTVRVAP